MDTNRVNSDSAFIIIRFYCGVFCGCLHFLLHLCTKPTLSSAAICDSHHGAAEVVSSVFLASWHSNSPAECPALQAALTDGDDTTIKSDQAADVSLFSETR